MVARLRWAGAHNKLFTPNCLIHTILHVEDCELLIKSKILYLTTSYQFIIYKYAVDHVKDLGVIIDEQQKFHLHVNHIIASAFTTANLILKCFTSRHVQTLCAFNAYVLPVI